MVVTRVELEPMIPRLRGRHFNHLATANKSFVLWVSCIDLNHLTWKEDIGVKVDVTEDKYGLF
jgi:hypothetical protein